MAATFVHSPWTEYGPCVEDCRHVDCAASRAQSAALCRYCRTAIGYDRRWIVVANMPAHEACAIDALESGAIQ